MELAIFDLDNTLIAGDSDHSWGEFLVSEGLVDAEAHKAENDRFYEDYLRGELDIYEYSAFALQILVGKDPLTLQQWHAKFMHDWIEPILLPAAKALIEEHRNAGRLPMIITATNRFVTGPIAEKLGIEHLLATEPEIIEGNYTGKISGTPCYQHGKVERLHDWLKETGHSLAGSWFYSDSFNDLPLLEIVDNPVAVDADEKLQAVAREKDWPVISLRN